MEKQGIRLWREQFVFGCYVIAFLLLVKIDFSFSANIISPKNRMWNSSGGSPTLLGSTELVVFSS